MKMELKWAKKEPKTKIGKFLCWIGLHRWKTDNYRVCKRCGRHQTLYEYASGAMGWED